MGIIVDAVNWTAVITGSILAFLLGWLWYSPLFFGTKWATGVGLTLEKAEPPPAAMVIQFLATLFLSGLVGVLWGLGAALVIVIMLIAFSLLVCSAGLFSQKSSYAIATEIGYIVAMVGIMVLMQIIF